MNPFEKINELKLALQQEVKSKDIQPEDKISCMEHYQRMLSLLALVEHELKDADYNYVASTLDNQQVKVFDGVTIKQEELTEGLLIFTPVAVDDGELGSIDMNSLYDILVQLRDSGRITEDIMVLPPYVNVIRAKLALPDSEKDNLDADWDAVEEKKAEEMLEMNKRMHEDMFDDSEDYWDHPD